LRDGCDFNTEIHRDFTRRATKKARKKKLRGKGVEGREKGSMVQVAWRLKVYGFKLEPERIWATEAEAQPNQRRSR